MPIKCALSLQQIINVIRNEIVVLHFYYKNHEQEASVKIIIELLHNLIIINLLYRSLSLDCEDEGGKESTVLKKNCTLVEHASNKLTILPGICWNI